MDAVSYANSAKQAKRIKKFIENPDSNSGIVTTPKVIQSGETITIPDGRMAVLPDLVIEGDLVLEGTGDVFIPAGSTLTGTVTLDTAQTITGQKEFTQSPKVPDGVEPTDVVNKGQLDNNSISKVASNVLLSGNVAVANSVITKSNANVTYTGNGGTQDIVTGIASVDFTVASNGSGYYHDRVAGDCIVKDDAGAIIESGSCVVNTSKVYIKCRNFAYNSQIQDGIRGVLKNISSSSTIAEASVSNSLTEFTASGITISNEDGVNQNTYTYILHQTLYTHIKWGLTSQGKRYICAYNPVTREVMTMYQGSGIAGHQIPNPLGIKLDYVDIKNLDGVTSWNSQYRVGYHLRINDTLAETADSIRISDFNKDYIELRTGNEINALNNTYISYGFANSETKIIKQYQGTGLTGNFVETKDVNGVARKPRRVIIKPTSITGDWAFFDGERGDFNYWLRLSSSAVEYYTSNEYPINAKPNGFSVDNNGTGSNGSGVQYIAIVEFDTTASNDDTYFDLPTDNTNLSITNGKLAFTNGRNSNGGYKVETQDFTGSVDFSGISDGIKYIARDKLGNVFGYDGVSIGLYDKTSADDNRLVFDTESGKWVTTTGGELVPNGTFDTDLTGWEAYSGSTISYTSTAIKGVSSAISNACFKSISNLGLTIGEEYVLSFSILQLVNSTVVSVYNGTRFLYPSTIHSAGDVVSCAFTAEEDGFLGFFGAGANAELTIDNISVYKKQATLGTELPNPICFIDDKPYQVTSGTPMDRLTDYPSIPKNIMESTYVDGMLISTGNRKVIELGTIYNNNRYVVDNPFGNDKYMDCDVKVQLYYNNVWFSTDYATIAGTGSFGTTSESLLEGIAVNTGTVGIARGDDKITGTTIDFSGTLYSAPARVIVTYVGVSK